MDKQQELFTAEIMVKLMAIERLLITKKVITADEVLNETKVISEQILKTIAQSIKDANDAQEVKKE